MAPATQLGLIQELHTKMRSTASHEFADAQRQNIPGQDEEAALVLAAKSGDGHAFEILIERYHRRILAVARRFTRIREDAEDIVQQSFQKAFVHLLKFEGKSSFSTWLTRIAINEALMLLRRSRGLREVSIDDLNGYEETALRLEMPDSRPGPESSFLQGEQNRVLSAAMNKLTPGTRKAIELRDLGELSTEEAARVMGLSVEAVKGRVFHGRRKLHQVLKHEPGWMSGKQILRANRKPNGSSRHKTCLQFLRLERRQGRLRSPDNPIGTRGKEVLGARYGDQEQFNDERKDPGMALQSKSKRAETLEVGASPIQSHAVDTSANHAPNHDEIRIRAYEIYLERGSLPGNDLDDWLQAERELERAALPKAQGFSIKQEAQ